MHPPVMIVFFSTSLRTTSSSLEDAKELNFLARMSLIVLPFIPRCAVSFMLLSLRLASKQRQRQPLLSPGPPGDRTSDVLGKSVSVRVDLGVGSNHKKKKT